jgi:hypothetical protein
MHRTVLSFAVLAALAAAIWLAAVDSGGNAGHTAQASRTALCLGTGIGCR